MHFSGQKSADQVNVLNIRGKHFNSCFRALSQCINLCILYASNNLIRNSDLLYLHSFKQLRILDLQFCKLTSLPEEAGYMIRLQILYLNNNIFDNWDSLFVISKLGSLIHLTFFNNPISDGLMGYEDPTKDYRDFLTKSMPYILAIDNYVISDLEKMESGYSGERFCVKAKEMRFEVP